MIKISRGHEPAEWTKERQTPGITYESARKDALRQSLLEEQGGLCGYCMRRIVIQPGTQPTTRIEHLKPRTLSLEEGKPEETLSYSNMILCCDGDIDGDANFHCDKSKAETTISFKPFDSAFINTISYSSKDGTIKSSNDQYDLEFNKVLNLNHPRLAKNRQEVIKGLVSELGKKKQWKKAEIEHKLKKYSSKSSDGQFYEYCGVVIWYLTKKLRQFA